MNQSPEESTHELERPPKAPCAFCTNEAICVGPVPGEGSGVPCCAECCSHDPAFGCRPLKDWEHAELLEKARGS